MNPGFTFSKDGDTFSIGDQGDGLSLASFEDAAQLVVFCSVERACVKLDVFFSSSGDVSDATVLVNLGNLDFSLIQAST
jgi:hypothetical protein